jgi:hypothetical protein
LHNTLTKLRGLVRAKKAIIKKCKEANSQPAAKGGGEKEEKNVQEWSILLDLWMFPMRHP